MGPLLTTSPLPPYDRGFNENILLRAVDELAPLWDLPDRLVMVALFDVARDLRVDIFELARLIVRSDISDPPADGSLNVFSALSLLSDAHAASDRVVVD